MKHSPQAAMWPAPGVVRSCQKLLMTSKCCPVPLGKMSLQGAAGQWVTLSSGAQARVSPEEARHGNSLGGPLRADGGPYVGLFHKVYLEGVGQAGKG